jgi:hypothetical protein
LSRHPSWFEKPLGELEEFIAAASSQLEGRSREIACRAVYHEISCLFEREIQQAAYNSGATAPSDPMLGDPEPTIGVRLAKLIPMVEEAIGVKLDELPGGRTIREVRDIANNFKHLAGISDPGGPISGGGIRLPSYHTISVEAASAAVADTRLFFRELWIRIEKD